MSQHAKQFLERSRFEAEQILACLTEDRNEPLPHGPITMVVGSVEVFAEVSRVCSLYQEWYPPLHQSEAERLYQASLSETGGELLDSYLSSAWKALRDLWNASLEDRPPHDAYQCFTEAGRELELRIPRACKPTSLAENEPTDSDDVARDRKALERSAIALLLMPGFGPNALKIAREIGVKVGTLRGWSTFMEQYEKLRADAKDRREKMRGKFSGANDFERDDDE